MKSGLYVAIFITGLLITSFTPSVLAGGGAVQPINFSEGQQIVGKSFSPEVAIKDEATNWTTPLVGKEFTLQASSGLAGASCDTTQRTTDSQGKVKANCKADATGDFSFKVVEVATGQSHAQFTVRFADTGSGSGFNEQGTTGTYTVSIVPGSYTAIKDTIFPLEAQLKKDGQVVTDFSNVDFFRWEVLQGSMQIVSGQEGKYRSPKFKMSNVGNSVLRVVAIMNDGKQITSGAMTVNVINQPSSTSSPTTASPVTGNSGTVAQSTPSPKPTVTPAIKNMKNSPSPSVSPSATASATPLASPVIDTDEELSKEVAALKQQVQEQGEQLNILQKIVKRLSDFVSNWFGN